MKRFRILIKRLFHKLHCKLYQCTSYDRYPIECEDCEKCKFGDWRKEEK